MLENLNNPVKWSADLFLVEWDAEKTITPLDGLKWGWEMISTGRASGSFINPSPNCPPAVCTGIDSSTFTWGTGLESPSSSLSFTGSSFEREPEGVFSLGKLSFFNGQIVEDTEVDEVDLDISVIFPDTPKTLTKLSATLSLINTLNTSDPSASADYVSFISGGFENKFNVLEGQSAETELLAKIEAGEVTPRNRFAASADDIVSNAGYKISLVGFGNVTGGGFITQQPVAVPEPSSDLSLKIISVFGLGIILKRKLKTFK